MSAAPQPPPQVDEMREFMLVLYRALLMITTYIERRYGLSKKH